jgi:outer membrane lipoprotein-sorting protein
MRLKKNALGLMLCLCLFGMHAHAERSPTENSQQAASNIDEVLGRLERKMAGMRTLQTGFIQEKKLAVFDQTLVLEGTIFLQKPGHFAWHVKKPMRYSLVMKEDTVRQWDEDTRRVQQIPLSKNPAFQAVVGQMRQWFSGTYTSLLVEYDVMLHKQRPVSLRFVPRKATVASNVINSVTVVFRNDERYVHQICIEEKSGDSTLLTFVDTLLNIPVGAEAWEVKPRVQ